MFLRGSTSTSRNNVLRYAGLGLCALSSIAVGAFYYVITSTFQAFYDSQADLGHIQEHYKLVPASPSDLETLSDLQTSCASGFWIAEVKTPEGWKLGGCVGLGEFSSYLRK
jgi:hypothetical protein